jgi:uncharacterized membrane protein YtjA (UPF0391 family)
LTGRQRLPLEDAPNPPGRAAAGWPFLLIFRNKVRYAPFSTHPNSRRSTMLYWALVFLVVAIIAGALGFGGIAGTSAGIAQILFFVFLAFLVISLLAGLFRRA